MTTLFKGASAAALAGTGAAGGIYFGTDLFKAEEVKKVSISSLIRDANPEKRLITATTVGDADWKAAYKTYRERNKDNEKDVWNLKDWSKPEGEVTLTEATQDFLSKCGSNSEVEVSGKDDPLYQQVLSYCTRNTLVSDLIKERSNGKQLLDTSSSGSGQEAEWKAAWGVYRTQNKDSGNGKNPWGINNWETEKEKEATPSDYKSKCAERVKKPAHKFDNEDYLNVLAWCTK